MLTKIRQAIVDFNMIADNDKIAVGLSGGKDSLALIKLLSDYQKYAPFHFEVIAVHLDMGFPNMDFTEIKNFLADITVPYIEKPTQIYEILKKNRNKDDSLPCSLCSKFKKALVIDIAKEQGCNKIAFAHHSEDAIETLWLNAIFGGKLATFRPKMFLSNTAVFFIRPLIYVREKELESYVKKEKLPVVKSTCPNDGYTKRAEVKQLLAKIYQEYPAAYANFLIMLANHDKIDLWNKDDYR